MKKEMGHTIFFDIRGYFEMSGFEMSRVDCISRWTDKAY